MRGLSRSRCRDALSGGVLSIGKLAAGQEAYYLDAVAHGAEDYYLEAGEVPGCWIGAGSEQLGLDGVVSDDAFVDLLAGVNPTDGSALGRPNRRVPALDLTFSAPKSVSVAWALGGPDVACAVVGAHEEAIVSALGYLEREAVFVRRGHNGAERLVGGGLVGAAFRHRTSRLGDPQLHTHVVVANAAQGPDGRWSALDARHLYAQARTAGFLYQAELRAGLSARLTAAWEPTVKGTGDLAVVAADARRAFSRRRAQIEAELSPDASAGDARRATLLTRPAKVTGRDDASLREEWAERGLAVGITRGDLAASLVSAEPLPNEAGGPCRVSAPGVCATLTEHRSSFDRRHVLQELAGRAQQGARVVENEAEADRLLAGDEVVPLGVGGFGLCYSTPELLAIEARLLDQASDTHGAEIGVVVNPEATLDDYRELSSEQVAMVETITTDGAGVSLVIGAAGSGKTHALSAARDAWTRAGYTVIGCALAARAAQQLQADSAIPSVTLDRLLIDLDRSDTSSLTPSTVVVADEAAMIGTRKLARLLDHAHQVQAKVVLVGDPHQLPEIEAGGAFSALADRLGASTLVENRRQQDPIERRALGELRAGHVDVAIDLLAEHGHVIEAPDRNDAHRQMIDGWYAAIQRGETAVMLALRRTDVDALNQLARQALDAGGHYEPERITIGGREYAVGDWVMTRRNDRQLQVVNGQSGKVLSVNDETLTVVFNDAPHFRDIPNAYIEAGDLDYAYAMTVHKSQGLTCDRAYVLGGEELYAEAGYTALSRGRLENRLYLTEPETDSDHHGADAPDVPIDVIRDALTRSDREPMATALIRFVDPPTEERDRTRHAEPVEQSIDIDDGIGW